MADYRDLLRRAIEALPENNGNARRQVYDKARAALRKQLDAIQPELPSREKTHHRLQLEECIREVEQEATERMLSGFSRLDQDNFGVGTTDPREPQSAGEDISATDDAAGDNEVQEPEDAPEPDAPSVPEPEPHTQDQVPEPEAVTEPEPTVEVTSKPEPEPESEPDAAVSAEPVPSEEPVATESERPPAEVSVPDAEPSVATVPVDTPEPKAASASKVTPAKPSHTKASASGETVVVPTSAAEAVLADAVAARANMSSVPVVDAADSRSVPDKKPLFSRSSSRAATPPPTDSPTRAMSAEREVDLDEVGDPQTAIDHAIAVLDREAKGGDALADTTIETTDPEMADLGFARAEVEDEGGGSPALTIFLVLVLLLLAGAGGAGYWAYREGYLDLSSLFGSAGSAVVSEAGSTIEIASATPPAVNATETPTTPQTGTETVEASHPGNTVATPDVVETPATGLEQADTTATDIGTADALALAETGNGTTVIPTMDGAIGEAGVGNTVTPGSTNAADAAAAVAEPNATDDKTEARLPIVDTATEATTDTTDQAATPDVVNNGSQSLLLEASDQANAGAVPFSGTVEWTRGVDELGQPTLQAAVDIPARNMSVSVLIRKNSDPSLPASHLVEINFTVSDSFIGGGISRIAGILMKNEELVQGVPLVGASARVVGNSFLFALSAAAQDVTSNNALLQSRKWMDLAIIYSTGKQAILTLEKDNAATALFDEVMTAWTPATTPTVPATTDAGAAPAAGQ